MDAIVDILADDCGTPGMINRTQRFRKIIVTAAVSRKRLLTISLLQEQLNCLVADVWQITGDNQPVNLRVIFECRENAGDRPHILIPVYDLLKSRTLLVIFLVGPCRHEDPVDAFPHNAHRIGELRLTATLQQRLIPAHTPTLSAGEHQAVYGFSRHV